MLKFTCCLKGPNKRSLNPPMTSQLSLFENEDKHRFQLYKSRLNGTKFCEVITTLIHPRWVDRRCPMAQ